MASGSGRHNMIPYADVREKADRAWTARLLERLRAPDLGDAERTDLVEALRHVADPRSFGPLLAWLVDPASPTPLRETAGEILRDMWHTSVEVPPPTLRRWWTAGDDLLRREALRWMGGLECPDVVRAVAADDGHPWQADALDRMTFWFDRPADEAVKIRALAHPDARVRAAAADVLIWDEPAAAEGPLLAATDDPDPAVVHAAIATLAYYPTRRVIRRLAELRERADGKFRGVADDAFGNAVCSVEWRMGGGQRSPRETAYLRDWLAPIWLYLEIDDDPVPSPARISAARPTPPAPPRLAALLDRLADPDTSPLQLFDQLHGRRWAAYSRRNRLALRATLLAHPDAVVRDRAAAILAAWYDTDGLLALLGDPSPCVRKSAAYHLGELPRSSAVAAALWAYFESRQAGGVHATEVLRSFVHHAPPDEAIRCLEPLAADDDEGECVRLAAIDGLVAVGATDEVTRLLPLLHGPPGVTWALHIALLAAIPTLGLPTPDLRHLVAADNWDLQVALAPLVA